MLDVNFVTTARLILTFASYMYIRMLYGCFFTRLWYLADDARYYSSPTKTKPVEISHRDYTATGKADTVETLLQKLNQDVPKLPGSRCISRNALVHRSRRVRSACRWQPSVYRSCH